MSDQLESGMQTILLMQIERRLCDLQRLQQGLPTMAQERAVQAILAREAEEAKRGRGRGRSEYPGRGRR